MIWSAYTWDIFEVTPNKKRMQAWIRSRRLFDIDVSLSLFFVSFSPSFVLFR